jgi:hypothetical protein
MPALRNQHPLQDLGQGFREAFTAVFDGNNLPTIEFPNVESANSLHNQSTVQFVAEDEVSLLTPSSGEPSFVNTEAHTFNDRGPKHRELLLLRSLFAHQQAQEPLVQEVPTAFLRAASDPTGVYAVEGSWLSDMEFLRATSNHDGREGSLDADPTVVMGLWEAYVWQATETSSMLQSLLMRVDWAMKQCSSSSVMFTRCVPLSLTDSYSVLKWVVYCYVSFRSFQDPEF